MFRRCLLPLTESLMSAVPTPSLGPRYRRSVVEAFPEAHNKQVLRTCLDYTRSLVVRQPVPSYARTWVPTAFNHAIQPCVLTFSRLWGVRHAAVLGVTEEAPTNSERHIYRRSAHLGLPVLTTASCRCQELHRNFSSRRSWDIARGRRFVVVVGDLSL